MNPSDHPRDQQGPGGESHADPVLARRHRIGRMARASQRVGYVLFAVALPGFFVSLITGSPPILVTVVAWSLILACGVLAPEMVIAYTVKAADRADREGAWR